MARLRTIAGLAVVLTLFLPGASRSDEVILANGKSYEDVIAIEAGGEVTIRFAYGEITLPASQVTEIRKAESSVELYLARRDALRNAPAPSAEDWLDLARWARVNGIDHGVREAALVAASLEPRLPGLPELLRPFGFVLDEEIGRWIPFEEFMARRGMVRFDGEWITEEEKDARVAEARRRLAAHERRVAAARERAAAAERAARSAPVRETVVIATVPGWLVPTVVAPVAVRPPLRHPPPPPDDGSAPPGTTPPRIRPPVSPTTGASVRGYEALVGRQPGSFIPVGGLTESGTSTPDR